MFHIFTAAETGLLYLQHSAF